MVQLASEGRRVRRHRVLADAVRLLALLVCALAFAGCGSGSGDADAKKAELIARSDARASGGSCEKVGDDAINGRVVTLYSCVMHDVPFAYRLVGQAAESTQRYCYAFANDAAVGAVAVGG